VTSKARTAIRQQLKQLEHEDAVQLGHFMLDRALGAQGAGLDRIPMQRVEAYLAENKYSRLEALLADIALGNRMPMQVAMVLVQQEQGAKPAQAAAGQVLPAGMPKERMQITGSGSGVVSFAQCCMPIPGDEIMGYHSAGKGIVLHRMECPNLIELRKSPERWVPVAWDRDVTGEFTVAIRVEAENRPGVLAKIASAIANAGANIDRVEYLERDSNIAVLRVVLDVSDTRHLADVIRGVRRLQVVQDVQRL
jgi:GTP diphosphokinase / guanosine-3',5'-bis(diphosphate) 3'-diphosphatase